MSFRPLLLAVATAIALPSFASAEPLHLKRFGDRPVAVERIKDIRMPSSGEIRRKLEVQPQLRVKPQDRVTLREFKRRPDLRHRAPAIDIQSINFAFGSAEIPYSQYGKVEAIADALHGLLSRNPGARVLIEGHTDAVGSGYSNYQLSEQRAASLKRMLVDEFGVSRRAIETVGYGEEYLLVPTYDENWQNRRVTLRRYDAFMR